MSTCLKCRHVRLPHETAPAWQCPACGVAYAKAAEASRLAATPAHTTGYHAKPEGSHDWLKWLVALAVVYGAWAALQAVSQRHQGVSSADIAMIAATVQAQDVVMYSTTECPYCAQAKSWLKQNGFGFTECNMSLSRECEQEFLRYGGTGTPYLVVRGQHMKNGFDSEEFLALLSKQ